MSTYTHVGYPRVPNKAWIFADRVRIVAGYGLLTSCFLGSLKFFGVPLPEHLDAVTVGIVMLISTYRIFKKPSANAAT